MASSEADHPLARTLRAIMDKVEVNILQTAKKWN